MKLRILVATVALAFAGNSQTEILNEDFQSGIPGTWTIYDNDGLTPDAQVSEYTQAWIIKEDPDVALDSTASSTSFFDPIGTADRWLVSPALNLGSFGNIIEWRAKSHDPSFPDSYKVLISTTDNQIASFTDTLILVSNELPTWITRNVNISDSGYNSGTVYIAFVNTTFNGFKLYIDDFTANIDDPVGIEENLVDINIYPNPASSILNLDLSKIEGKVEHIRLINAVGQVVFNTTKAIHSIDLSTFDSGIYSLEVVVDGRVSVKKISKL